MQLGPVDHRGVLTLLVVGEVAAGPVEIELADVRREDLVVSLLPQFLADEVLELLADDRAVRGPEHEALADLFIDVEQAELLAEDPMVPLLRLFEQLQVLLQLLLVGEGDAVDAGQSIALLVAVPVARREVHDLERADPPGGRNVGASAEILPVGARGSGGVPGEFARAGLDRPLRVVELVLRSFLAELVEARAGGHLVAGEGAILLHDPLHLRFDPLEVLAGDRGPVGKRHVVVEALLDRRTVDQLDAREQVGDRLRHHVGGGMAKQEQAVRIHVALAGLRGDEGEFAIRVDRRVEVRERSVDDRAERRFRETGADVGRDLGRRGGTVELAFAPVGKRDAGHGGLLLAKGV